MLAERVSPAGRVVGLDADPAHTSMAAEFAARRGLSGVQIVTADAGRTGLPAASFDLVHTRTLLVNLPEPATVAAEMVRLAKPGGWVASMEPDTEYGRCYPPHPAFDRLCEILPWSSAAMVPIRGSAGGYRSSSARRERNTSKRRPGCRCTRWAIPGGPSASIWCAHPAAGAGDGSGQPRGTR